MKYSDELTYLDEALDSLENRKRNLNYENDFTLWQNDMLPEQYWCWGYADHRETREPELHQFADGSCTQRQFAFCFNKYNRGMWVGINGLGKSLIIVQLALYFFDVHGGTTRYFAANSDNIKTTLMQYFRQFIAMWNLRYERGEIDHMLDLYVTGDNEVKVNKTGRVIFSGRAPMQRTKESMGRMAGAHGMHDWEGQEERKTGAILAIIDEGSDLNADSFEAMRFNAVGSMDKFWSFSNPLNPTGYMGQAFKTFDKDFCLCRTSFYFTPNCPDNGVDAHPLTKQGMFSLEEAERIEKDKEDDPHRYRVRVQAEFDYESMDSYINASLVQQAQGRYLELANEEKPIEWSTPIMALDLGEEGGSDPSVLYASWREVAGGRVASKVIKVFDKGAKYAEVIEALVDYYIYLKCSQLTFDAIGIGSHFDQRIYSWCLENDVDFLQFNFEPWKASWKSGDRDRWLNARAYAWWNLKELMRDGLFCLDPIDDRVLDEIISQGYTYVDEGRSLKMASKEEMRRHGIKSPNRADALVISLLEPDIIEAQRGVNELKGKENVAAVIDDESEDYRDEIWGVFGQADPWGGRFKNDDYSYSMFGGL